MVSSEDQDSIYDIKISTVSSGSVCGNDAFQELTAIDLAMKLHYLRFVHYFKKPAFDGFTITKIKETMFDWLIHAYIPCGRFRRTDSGRPVIKLNDAGVRIVEAKCYQSLDEWLESKDDSRHKLLVPSNVIGPELAFSPLVMIQLTQFKCGATSVGMSWSHVLGDAFSAMSFIRLWFQVIAGHFPTQPLTMAQPQAEVTNIESQNPSPGHQVNASHYSTQPLTMAQPQANVTNIGSRNPSLDLLSIKRVGPVGDLWSTSSYSKMETFSIYISMSELTQLQTKICQEKASPQIPLFECICVVIWHCLGKIRHRSGPQVVTLCKSDLSNRTKGTITNKTQIIGVVKSDIPIVECTPMQLGLLMMNQVVDERMKIEEAMENEDKVSDFLLYGVNLSFVDLSDASFYDIEMRGHKPIYVNCVIDNIDDEGVVLVLPTPKGCSDGRIVNITLAENEVVDLKMALKKDWCIG